MLYLIGLGLDWKDLSLKALEALHKCDEVYLENYTSLSNYTTLQLEKLIGKKIIILDRQKTEEGVPFLKNAHLKEVALLIYGDPLSATTHFEILAEARKLKIETTIIHAPSIFTAVAETGLSLYKFGKVASLPLPIKNITYPTSPFEVLKENLSINAHTLFLLEINVSEKTQSEQSSDAPHRSAVTEFLTIKEAIDLLSTAKAVDENALLVGCARLGTTTTVIKASNASELTKVDWGEAPFCLIVPARLNHKEEEYLQRFK